MILSISAVIGGAAVTVLPGGCDRGTCEHAVHMIALCLAHIPARGGGIDAHAFGVERLDQRPDRRLAAEIDHRARPIEDDQIEMFLQSSCCHPGVEKTGRPILRRWQSPWMRPRRR